MEKDNKKIKEKKDTPANEGLSKTIIIGILCLVVIGFLAISVVTLKPFPNTVEIIVKSNNVPYNVQYYDENLQKLKDAVSKINVEFDKDYLLNILQSQQSYFAIIFAVLGILVSFSVVFIFVNRLFDREDIVKQKKELKELRTKNEELKSKMETGIRSLHLLILSKSLEEFCKKIKSNEKEVAAIFHVKSAETTEGQAINNVKGISQLLVTYFKEIDNLVPEDIEKIYRRIVEIAMLTLVRNQQLADEISKDKILKITYEEFRRCFKNSFEPSVYREFARLCILNALTSEKPEENFGFSEEFELVDGKLKPKSDNPAPNPVQV